MLSSDITESLPGLHSLSGIASKETQPAARLFADVLAQSDALGTQATAFADASDPVSENILDEATASEEDLVSTLPIIEGEPLFATADSFGLSPTQSLPSSQAIEVAEGSDRDSALHDVTLQSLITRPTTILNELTTSPNHLRGLASEVSLHRRITHLEPSVGLSQSSNPALPTTSNLPTKTLQQPTTVVAPPPLDTATHALRDSVAPESVAPTGNAPAENNPDANNSGDATTVADADPNVDLNAELNAELNVHRELFGARATNGRATELVSDNRLSPALPKSTVLTQSSPAGIERLDRSFVPIQASTVIEHLPAVNQQQSSIEVRQPASEPASDQAAELVHAQTTSAGASSTTVAATQASIAPIRQQATRPKQSGETSGALGEIPQETDLRSRPSEVTQEPEQPQSPIDANVENAPLDLAIDDQVGKSFDQGETILGEQVQTSLADTAPPHTNAATLVSPAGSFQAESAKTTATQPAMNFTLPTSASVSQQVVGSISQAIDSTDDANVVRTISMELQPEELGHLKIRIEQSAEAITAHIIATESLSVDLLQGQKNQLLESLSELGYENASVDISHGDNEHAETSDDQLSRHSTNKQNFNTSRSDASVGADTRSSGLNIVV